MKPDPTSLKRVIRAALGSSIRTFEELPYRLPTRRARSLRLRNESRDPGGAGWFSPSEAILVEALADSIVPSEEEKPGLGDIDVLGLPAARVIGRSVHDTPAKQGVYSRGLLSFERFVERRYPGKEYPALPQPARVDLLRELHERHRAMKKPGGPIHTALKHAARLRWLLDGTSEAVDLFPVLVQDCLRAFYTSRVAWTWLEYDGPPMPIGYPDPTVARSPGEKAAVADLSETARLVPENLGIPQIATGNGESVDVVVIGSGAGGAVVAKELGEAGASVVVLEAGPRFNPHADYVTHREDFELSARDTFLAEDGRRDAYTTPVGNRFQYTRVKGVGGSTLKYVAVSPRLHESDFRVFSEDGVAEDWPIGYGDLEPYYTRVERELGVSGPGPGEGNPFDPPRGEPYPTPPHPFNLASRVIKRGAAELGLHMVREPLAIPTREWGGRPACIGAGTCQLGCAIASKSSMDVTYIPKAIRTGNVEIRPNSTAWRIVLGPDGLAKHVLYFDKDGREQKIASRAVVVAGNAIETPRLLLLSASGLFPDGLANSSGMVGKNFMEHLAVFAFGRFHERVDPWRGTPTGGMIQDYYATDPKRGFARGWTILLSSYSHWPLAVANRIPGWGLNHKRMMEEQFAHTVCVASVGEQLPDSRNRISLDDRETDSFGLPVPRLTNQPRENDLGMISAISSSLRDLLAASGAVEIWDNQQHPGGSSHFLGTCRMGSDPGRSVVDAWGRTHDVPNLFVADGSVLVTGGAVNPALTISALATRTAEEISRAGKRREL